MWASTEKGEAAATRGGLRARLHQLVTNAAIVRLVALSVGLTTLGLLGQCLATPARASPTALAAASAAPPIAATSAPFAASSIASAPVALAVPCTTGASANANDAGSANGSLVELNTATLEDLRRLPGIGPRRATAILELRAKLGGFRKLEDLMRVRGLGRGAMKRLRPLVTVNVGPPKS